MASVRTHSAMSARMDEWGLPEYTNLPYKGERYACYAVDEDGNILTEIDLDTDDKYYTVWVDWDGNEVSEELALELDAKFLRKIRSYLA